MTPDEAASMQVFVNQLRELRDALDLTIERGEAFLQSQRIMRDMLTQIITQPAIGAN
jgi:hypothetical protein